MKGVLAVLAALLAAGVSLVGASSAVASNAGPVSSVVDAYVPTSVSGDRTDPVRITAPAACDRAATRHVTKILSVTAANPNDRAAAKEWVGDNLYATASVGLPGPLTVESSNSWQGLADGFGQKLVPGRYTFVLRCQNNVGTRIYEEWHGGVTFVNRTTWRGFTGAAGSARASGDSTPTKQTSPTEKPTTTKAPAPRATPTSSPTSAGAAAGSASASASRPGSALSGPAPSGPAASGSDVTDVAAERGPERGPVIVLVVFAVLVAAGAALLAIRRRRHRDVIGHPGR